MICPACVANAAMAVAGVTGTSGGVTAIAWRILRWRGFGKKSDRREK